MLKHLHATLEAADWPRALELALAAWRETRAPALADLVEHIAARLPVVPFPDDKQATWIARAQAYVPTELDGLTASIVGYASYENRDVKRKRWRNRVANPLHAVLVGNGWFQDAHERIAALLEWPDDPRLARALVGCVAAPVAGYAQNTFTVYRAVGDRIAAIRDVRMIPLLERCAAEPRGRNDHDRDLQVRVAISTIERLARVSTPSDPEPDLPGRAASRSNAELIAACAAIVAPPPLPPPVPPPADLDALWREVAANPTDMAARSVLGDALVQAGDLRGDLIVLSCNARKPGRPLRRARTEHHDGRVKTLVRTLWDEWLGDLGLVISRRGSEVHCGMLEVIAVGHHWTPPWAWPKAVGHRELSAVHTVRPCWAPPALFADFVAALPRDPQTLAIDSPLALEALARVRSQLATTRLEFRRDPITYPRGTTPPAAWGPPRVLLAACELAARIAPAVTEIAIDVDVAMPQVTETVAALPAMFPQLARIAVARRAAPAEVAILEPFRFVEIVEPARKRRSVLAR